MKTSDWEITNKLSFGLWKKSNFLSMSYLKKRSLTCRWGVYTKILPCLEDLHTTKILSFFWGMEGFPWEEYPPCPSAACVSATTFPPLPQFQPCPQFTVNPCVYHTSLAGYTFHTERKKTQTFQHPLQKRGQKGETQGILEG